MAKRKAEDEPPNNDEEDNPVPSNFFKDANRESATHILLQDPAPENEEEEEEDSDYNSVASDDSDDIARNFVMNWIEDKRLDGATPTDVLGTFFRKYAEEMLKGDLPEEDAWDVVERVLMTDAAAICRAMASVYAPHRVKLPHINTIDDAIELVRNANRIVVLTGAGVSVSCGIPDFRSPGGLYATIEEKYNLPEPQCLFDIHFLRDDPTPFFEFAREIYPGSYIPSPTHYFIKELDQRGKLLRNYTQNIDTLEKVAGIDPLKVVNCHGSFATASCIKCKTRVDGNEIKEDIMNKVIPKCKACSDDEAFMKPDIVFFGEALPARFDECLRTDATSLDLLLVMGSSLAVKPVAFVPDYISRKDPNIPQLLINRELVAKPHEFDYASLGDCDDFVLEVCRRLDWTLNGKHPDTYVKPKPPPPPPTIPVEDATSSTAAADSSSVAGVVVREETTTILGESSGTSVLISETVHLEISDNNNSNNNKSEKANRTIEQMEMTPTSGDVKATNP